MKKSSIKKERTFMVVSAAFVLTALTITGIYMKPKSEEQDNGYTIDFQALEESLQNDTRFQIEPTEPSVLEPKQEPEDTEKDSSSLERDKSNTKKKDNKPSGASVVTDSARVENPDRAMGQKSLLEEAKEQTFQPIELEMETPIAPLSFEAGEYLQKPLSGALGADQVAIPFRMDGSVYFETLDQYKYNPATIYQCQQEDQVLACADGRVLEIFQDEELGHGLKLDLGSGYVATYGQLHSIEVMVNDYVEPGQLLAAVAPPTKYYHLEGPNLYFKIEKDGIAINPTGLYGN